MTWICSVRARRRWQQSFGIGQNVDVDERPAVKSTPALSVTFLDFWMLCDLSERWRTRLRGEVWGG